MKKVIPVILLAMLTAAFQFTQPAELFAQENEKKAEEKVFLELPAAEGDIESAEGAVEEEAGAEVEREEQARQREQVEPEPMEPLDIKLPALPAEEIEAGAPKEGEIAWGINIQGAVMMNYVFNNSPDSFTIKYAFEIKGDAFAETAVVKGDANITADVDGYLSKWPTGECRLEIAVPKIPFELTFKKTEEEKGNLRLVFKQAINEEWQSKCTFTDAPGKRFDTKGEPEKWLTKALDKARPPLKSILAELKPEETTTTFVISKEIVQDAPLGSGEIEGKGVITIRPGGNE